MRMDPFLLKLLWSILFWLSFLLWWRSVYIGCCSTGSRIRHTTVCFSSSTWKSRRWCCGGKWAISKRSPWTFGGRKSHCHGRRRSRTCRSATSSMMLRDQIGMLRNQTQNQKAQDQQVHNPLTSQMHWLLCEYMAHRCQIMKPSEERLNRKSDWYERRLLKLFQVTLFSDLFNLKLCDTETQRRHYQNFPLRWSPRAMEQCIIRDITAIFWPRQQLDQRRFMDGVISAVMNQPRLEEFLGWRYDTSGGITFVCRMPIPM